MRDLPAGWARATLGEVGDYLNGRGFRKHEWSDRGRPIIRIQNLTGSGSSFNYYDGKAEESYIARRGDLLISWAATLGAFVWDGPEAVVNQHIFKVRSFIDSRFHRYLVTSMLDELQRKAHGSGMVHVTRRVFDETAVGLPPLAEQRRIVAAIEEQLARLVGANETLNKLNLRAEAFRRSVLQAELGKQWSRHALGEVAETQLGKMLSPKSQAGANARPYLRNKNVQWWRIDVDDLLQMDFNEREVAKFELAAGDVLVCEGGEVGRAAIWRGEVQRCCFQKALHRVRPSDDLSAEYLILVLRWLAYRNEFAAHVTGSTIAHLPQEDLRQLSIPLPPRYEQDAIVRRVRESLDRVGRLVNAANAIDRQGRRLRRSVLAHAFRGELVPQDANDEPANVLLERITAERAAGPTSVRKRGEKASI